MPLVAGIDSSTQSCKVVVRDAETGRLLRTGSAPHPAGTEVDPEAWWTALLAAMDDCGGISDVSAIAVAGQQHGMVCLDDDGAVIRPALLWNDTRSAPQATDLVAELGGPEAWADAVGSVPLAAFTVTKLRWLAEHEPGNAARVAAVCLPHDWLTWRLSGSRDIADLTTDRSDASGTGYFDPTSDRYRRDLVELALGRVPLLPTVAAPNQVIGSTAPEPVGVAATIGPGMGDNASAALALGAEPGTAIVSLGTSGVVSVCSATPTKDPSGLVAGFADALGGHLPLVCTLNGAPVLSTVADLLGVGLTEFSDLALAAQPGAQGVRLIPYFAGERTPDLPDATAELSGLTYANATRANLARAAVEALLGTMRDAIGHVRGQGCAVERAVLIGGGARSAAIRTLASDVLGVPVTVPEPGEYVADGAARQAAWAAAGTVEPPSWSSSSPTRR
jgi:xylulokinase